MADFRGEIRILPRLDAVEEIAMLAGRAGEEVNFPGAE